MIKKSVIIANNATISKQIENWMAEQILQLKLVGKSNNTNEAIQLLKQKQPQLVFVNLQDLTSEDILQLQQMKQSAFSIVFVTPGFMEERFIIPQKVFNQKQSKTNTIQLKIDKVTQGILSSEIVRLEACSNYTKIYLANRIKPILTSKTLKFYADQLHDMLFIRPHQSHIVNCDFIQKTELKPQPYLLLKNGIKICIARRRMKAFKNRRLITQPKQPF